ncbi:hypothetical protein HU200_036196 [Digitaria exilis]|uniref:Uncharacterized protein n=1 Tax=Digitaria exilis TaxID=1010633 RepID=A0A835BGT9_9POAL|nr:hypothetical protein HU200_036196 [Digitaria exilis]
MHDLVHDLATSLLGDEILDQSIQGNTRGSSCRYALLLDCSKPLESYMPCPASLSALRYVDCQGTELRGSAFESAGSLHVLDLSECLIQKLPDSFGRLKQLRNLNAPRIRGPMVPECITTLSNLRYLSLRGSCPILALPEAIGNMEGLVHIDLSGCVGIKELPESFCNLTSLEHFDFAYCENVTGLSQCLARFTKLQHLNLSNCKNIEDLTIALGSLTELRYLNLSDSSCLSFKSSEAEFLGSLTKLRYLNLSSRNKATSKLRLPESLSSLTGLEYLDLSHNTNIRKLPASFGNLCNLVHLDLSECFVLVGVPAALNGLTKLQYLDLSGCRSFSAMEELKQILSNLSELRHLNLAGYIKCLQSSNPDEINNILGQICTLTNLEYLNLGHNGNIRSVPEALANLKRLHTLDISSTKIWRLPESIKSIDSLKFLYTQHSWLLLDEFVLARSRPNFLADTGGGESSSYPFQLESKTPCLKLSSLENVKSVKEARTLRLREKASITKLVLQWDRDAKRFMDDAEVLRELEPPYSVSEFYLEGYNSVIFPSWVMRINHYLPGLTKIEMSDLPSCNNLPPLGQLPNLRFLTISGMDSIKKIGADLYGATGAFPRLWKLVIAKMKCLEEWMTAVSTTDEDWFHRIRSVDVCQCPRLRFKPRPPQCDNLWIDGSDGVILSSLSKSGQVGASAITHLQVASCEMPLHRWSLLHQLPCLKRLTFVTCSDLTCRSPGFLRRLTSLQSLTVSRCRRIVSLLEILGDLTSLRELQISGCYDIKTLPERITELTCLRTLKVINCRRIVSLPKRLGDLTSLDKLEVFGCRGIRSLPDTIQKLTCLESLTICECPKLVEWCKSKENKMKLAHIKKSMCPHTYCVRYNCIHYCFCSLSMGSISMLSILCYRIYLA